MKPTPSKPKRESGEENYYTKWVREQFRKRKDERLGDNLKNTYDQKQK